MRRKSNFTLDQLAATSGVDRGTISRIELGHVSPRIDTISFLCEAMGSTLGQFFTGPAGGDEPGDLATTARPGSLADPAEAARPELLPGPAGPARQALGLTGPEPDGYWPVPSHFWHGMLEVLDRFEALVKNSGELILVFDRGGVILYASPAARTILDRRSSDLVGRHYRSLVHPGDLRRLEEALAALAPGATTSLDYRLRHKDGSWRSISATFCNMLDNPSVLALVSNGVAGAAPAQG